MTASILDNRFIFVFGGYNNEVRYTTVEKYDIKVGKEWLVINCRLPERLSNLTSVAITSSEILLFGG